MAGNTIDINLSVMDKSSTIKSRTNDAKELNKQLERSQSLMAGTGTKSGAAARQATFISGGQVEDYNRSRGVAGVTGASARDFADQARSLGGLVRLYAAYAANIFAVTAAFNALREAMQTDMLIRSLNQLGASSGIALGGLAKQFAATTDGAISLREAAEATAKAMSSGMTKEQFLQLGQVAKGAAQALGLNMGDAVSRLTRGIVKLEPELLDELGLFTKVGKAADDYARSIGKTEAQLTDFERRQAFANAVLKEGRDKFGEIAQEGNPYDKLLAELKNVATDILNVVNTIVSPIAKLLADNTGLIAGAIALAAIKITKSALPALGQWRAGLEVAAKDAAEKATLINRSFQEAFAAKQEQALGIPVLQKNLDEAKKQLKLAQQELLSTSSSIDKRVSGSKWFARATTEDVANEKTIAKLQESSAKLSQSEAVDKQKIAAAMAKVADAQKLVLQRSEALANVDDTLQEGLQKRARVLSELWQREEIRDRAREKAARLRILSEVSKDVDEKGFFGGIQELYNKANADKDLSRLGKFLTVFQGTMIGAARAVGILANALNRAFFYFEIAVGVFFALDAVLGKNSKQVKEFTNSLDVLEESTKGATLALEKYVGVISVDSVIAVSNAFNGLSLSVEDVRKKFEAAQKTASKWDTFWDDIKEGIIFLDSQQEKAASSISKAIVSAIETAPEGELRNSLQAKLQGILGNIDLTGENIAEALEKLNKDGFKATLENLSKALEGTDKLMQKSKGLATEVRESAKQAQLSYQNLANSVRDQTPLSKFLSDNLRQLQALESAARDATASRAALDELVKLGETSSFGNQALQAKELLLEFENLDKQASSYKKTLKEQEESLKKISQEMKGQTAVAIRRKGLDTAAITAAEDINTTKRSIDQIEIRITQINTKVASLIKNAVKDQLDSLFKQYDLQIQKLKLQGERSRAALGSGIITKETIDYQADLTIQGIQIEQQLVKVNEKLVLSTELNRIAQQKLTDELTLIRLQQERRETKDSEGALVLDRNIANLKQRIDSTKGLDEQVAKIFGRETKKGTKEQLAELKTLMDQPGGSAYFSIIQLLQSQLQREVQATEEISTENVKRKLAQIANDIDVQKRFLDNSIRGYTQQLDSIRGIISTGDSAELNVYLQDLKFATEQLDIQKGIEQDTYMLSTKLTAEGKKAFQSKVSEGKARLVILQQQQQEKRIADILAATEQKRNEQLKFRTELREQELELFQQIYADDPQKLEGFRRELYELKEQDAKQVAKNNIDKIRKATRDQEKRVSDYGQDAATDSGASQQYSIQLKILQALNEELDRLIQKENQRAVGSIVLESARQANYERQENLRIIDQINQATLFNLEIQNNLRNLEQERFDLSIESDRARLDLQTQLGLLTQDEINKENSRLKQRQIANDLQQKLNNLKDQETRLNIELGSLEAKIRQDDSGALSAPEGVLERIKFIKDQLVMLEQAKKFATTFADTQNKILSEQDKFDDRLKNYSQSFKNLFDGMADAIVNFAKTGKFEFKDLINSFLEDILRYELRLQMHALYVQALRPMLGNFLDLLLGGNTYSSVRGNFLPETNQIGGFTMAKGGAFNRGVEAYARGGMFTNSIVNQPTLFKAAKGLGVMGEAGPEAIMPLKRDSQGNLGVRSNQGSVEIVVNNYTSQQAETKETTDSRGNRRIEVTIGDIVADQMTTNNSSIQQAMLVGYGAKPRMIRR
jgi:phage-related minor tail protein